VIVAVAIEEKGSMTIPRFRFFEFLNKRWHKDRKMRQLSDFINRGPRDRKQSSSHYPEPALIDMVQFPNHDKPRQESCIKVSQVAEKIALDAAAVFYIVKNLD
jgi:hypothetical protein